jgi:NUMOD4 motif/HNH endonuclease
MTKIELWKPVVGFAGKYEVSSLGRVRSFLRKEAVIRNATLTDGYRRLYLFFNGVRVAKSVHVLVAEAFLGAKPFQKAQVNHINSNRSDNRVENLEWTDNAGNNYHALKQGKFHAATNPNRSVLTNPSLRKKLTPELVESIRAFYDLGIPQNKVAEKFSIAKSTVWLVIRGMAWPDSSRTYSRRYNRSCTA